MTVLKNYFFPLGWMRRVWKIKRQLRNTELVLTRALWHPICFIDRGATAKSATGFERGDSNDDDDDG